MRLVPRRLVACLVVLLVGALSPGVANASGGSSSQPCRHGDELFTFGFSQAGHAALALQRALQRQQVEVTATATVGEVAFGDMLVSVDRLRRRGAEVTVRPVPGDHVTSWIRAMPRAAAYFRKLS
jgi:hypothetical protein